MGCGGSRFDKRKDFADDLFTVSLNFIGGEGGHDDGCPCDKVVFSFAKGEKEPSEVYSVDKFTGKAEEEMKLKNEHSTMKSKIQADIDLVKRKLKEEKQEKRRQLELDRDEKNAVSDWFVH